MAGHPRRLEQADIDALFNAYQEAGGGSGRYPMLWPTVSVQTIHLDRGADVWEWAQYAANQGITRQIHHDKLIDAVTALFTTVRVPNYTNVWIARPRPMGSGDVTTNGNLVIILPPRRDGAICSPMYVIEIGCEHKVWQAESAGACCTRYRCEDCGYTYEVDSSD